MIQKGGNQNPYIEEGQTTQWPKEKVQRDKQRSTKHTYTTKDRVTRTPLKPKDKQRSTKHTYKTNIVSIEKLCAMHGIRKDRYYQLYDVMTSTMII